MSHTIKKTAALILIVFLAFALRFYQLGSNPPSLDWDESSLGYNAYSILKTGSDEYGNKFPLSIRSFNDFKPPLYVYSAIPGIAAFGLSEWSVRFPSALGGTLTVLLAYFLVSTFLEKNSQREKIALAGAFFLAISPWHIQLSRVAFESNLAVFCFVGGALFLFQGLSHGKLFHYMLAALFFALSLYAYHSARLVAPLFILSVAALKRDALIRQWKQIAVALLFALLLLLPLGISTLRTTTQGARFNAVSIFSATGLHDVAKIKSDVSEKNRQADIRTNDPLGAITHNKYLTFAQLFAKNYLDHFNFDFLFLTGDRNPRHHAPDVGQLLIVEAPLLLLGIFLLLQNQPKFSSLIFAWLLVSPVASALTTETPHAVRSSLMLPSFQIIEAYGLVILKSHSRFYRPLVALAVILFTLNFLYFTHQYFIHAPIEYASSWQYGYKQMVASVITMQDQYDAVYVTRAYDQPYIYFLFYGNVDPSLKNDGSFSEGFGKYHFVNWPETTKDSNQYPSSLIVTAPSDRLKPGVIDQEIHHPDGTVAFFVGRGL